MWRTNLAVAFVVLGTLGVYTAVANMIPQVQSDVPEELVLSADVSPEELVAAGENLYAGSGGGCTACHGLGTRAPDILGTAGSTCETREPGKSCKDYLYESLVDPGAYVVEGFQPIMPDMSRTLSDAQIWSLVAFLESQGGEVTVTGADFAGSDDGPPPTPADPVTDGDAAPGDIDAAALVQSLGCTACHAYGASPGGIGPALSEMAGLELDYLRRSIIDPAADTATGFEALAGTMPATFGELLTESELEAMVTYLAGGAE